MKYWTFFCIKGKFKGKETIPPVSQEPDTVTGDNLQETSQDANMTATSAQIRPTSNLAEWAKGNIPDNEEGDDIYASKDKYNQYFKEIIFYFSDGHINLYMCST